MRRSLLERSKLRPEGWYRDATLSMSVDFRALTEPHYAAMGAATGTPASRGHFEQTGQVRGAITIGGRTMQVVRASAYGTNRGDLAGAPRHRLREDDLQRSTGHITGPAPFVNWFSMNFGEALALGGSCGRASDGVMRGAGWIHHDGRTEDLNDVVIESTYKRDSILHTSIRLTGSRGGRPQDRRRRPRPHRVSDEDPDAGRRHVRQRRARRISRRRPRRLRHQRALAQGRRRLNRFAAHDQPTAAARLAQGVRSRGPVQSFRAAAEELHVTPSAVSHHVRSLERRLGRPLFERAGNSVKLTREGEALRGPDLRRVRASGERGRGVRPPATRRLTIGAFPFLVSEILVPNLGELRARLPGVSLAVVSETHLGLLTHADPAQRIDAIVRYGDGRFPACTARKLTDIELVPVASPKLLGTVNERDAKRLLAHGPASRSTARSTAGPSGQARRASPSPHDRTHSPSTVICRRCARSNRASVSASASARSSIRGSRNGASRSCSTNPSRPIRRPIWSPRNMPARGRNSTCSQTGCSRASSTDERRSPPARIPALAMRQRGPPSIVFQRRSVRRCAMAMQALYFNGARSLEWRDVAQPRLEGAGEALVRPLAVATCDLDVAIVAGKGPFAPPFAIGHEFAGEIVELGDAVQNFRIGDRVAVAFQPSCGGCAPCRRGHTAACTVAPGTPMYGIGVTGGDWGGGSPISYGCRLAAR